MKFKEKGVKVPFIIDLFSFICMGFMNWNFFEMIEQESCRGKISPVYIFLVILGLKQCNKAPKEFGKDINNIEFIKSG